MDLLYIFNVLWKRKWMLMLVAIATAGLTYLFLKLLPAEYKAEAIMATGIIEQKGFDVERRNVNAQQFQVNTRLDNIQNRMRSRSSLRRLSYYLLQHDLTALKEGGVPYKMLESEEVFDKEKVTPLLTFLNHPTEYDTPNQEQATLLRQLADDFGYDFESLSEQLNIIRDGNTDYLKVIFRSENPELSAFVVNKLSDDFSTQYNLNRIQEENTSIRFYQELAATKKKDIDSLTIEISKYKQNQGIVDLEEEGTFLIAEANDLKLAKEEEQKRMAGLKRAIAQLNQYLEEQEVSFTRADAENLLVREEVSKLKEEKGALLEQYNLRGRIDEDLQTAIDQADVALNVQLEKLAAERLAAISQKEQSDELKDILFRRIDREMDLILAEESIKSIEEALARIQADALGYVTDEAVLENLEGEKAILTDEYLNVVGKMQEAKRIALLTATPLEIIEYAEVPEEPESSKAKILAALAGIVAAGVVALLLVLLSFFDNKLTAERFELLTEMPLLGKVKTLASQHKDINQIFERPTQQDYEQIFREDIRKVRYSIEHSQQKKFLFTSPEKGDGKTFNIISLAYALSVMRKKVLIVDTNLKNNSLTVQANRVLADNPLFNGVRDNQDNSLNTIWELHENVHVLGNQGGDYSPAELLAGRDFSNALNNAAEDYDYVFMEAPAMNHYTDTRELVEYADKIITVFKENTAYKAADKQSVAFLKKQEGKLLGGIINNPTS